MTFVCHDCNGTYEGTGTFFRDYPMGRRLCATCSPKSDGDPIVSQIVKKMYGEDPEWCESVVLRENQVIVSRETLETLMQVGRWWADEMFNSTTLVAAISEAREALGS